MSERQKQKRELPESNRRKLAEKARKRGVKASAVGLSTGASKQRKKAGSKKSHQQKLKLKREGKRTARKADRARPGNREVDPRRK